jgi:hypothetical protein
VTAAVTGAGGADRVALVMGTSTFGDGFAPLPSVPDELRLMKAVLTESADCVIHPKSDLNPSVDELKAAFEQALDGDGTPPDLLILYYSGHAIDISDGDLFIAAHNSSKRELNSMLRADDLFALILPELHRPRPREVVILLDTCRAGLAVARFRREQGVQEAKGGDMPVLTVFGAVDRVHDAQQLHFVESFAAAVRTAPAADKAEYVPMHELYDELAGRMRKLRGDQGDPPVPQFLGSPGKSRAFLNPWYAADVRLPREAGEGSGWAFCGRAAAVEETVSYLYGEEAAGGLAVTGGAGSGKSLLLDWIHTAAHGKPLPAGPGAPAPVADDPHLKLVDVRGLTLRVVLSRLSRLYELRATPSDSPQALIDALSEQPGPLRICFDSVDACAEPDRLYAELVAPLAALDHARVVVAGSHAPSGFTGRQLDLDGEEFADPDGIAAFVAHVLHHRKGTTWAYADQRWIGDIARDTAQAAGESWLRAYLFAVSLSADDPATATVRAERSTADLFLEQLAALDEDDPRWAREMLMPVALAQGEGLPADGRLWAAVLSTGGHRIEAADLTRVQQKASEFLAAPEGGMYGHGWRFERSPHARYLAESDEERAWHRRFVQAMTGQLPRRDSGALDWTAADRYTREHFAHHAHLAGVLTQYLHDPEFLLMMNSEALHRVLTVLHDGKDIASLRTLCGDLARTDRTDGHTLSRMALLAQVHGLPELARRARQSAVGWQPQLTYGRPTATVHCLPDGGEVLVDDQDDVQRNRGDHTPWEKIALRVRDARVTTTSLTTARDLPALFAGQIDGKAWVQLLERVEDTKDHQEIGGLELNCRLVACVTTPAGMLIAGTDGWQWRSDQKTRPVVRPRGLRLGGAAAAVHDEVPMVAARTAKDVSVWSADGTFRHTYETQQTRSLTAIAADTTGVYTGAGDGSVWWTSWDDPTRRRWITTHAGQVVELRVREGTDGPTLISAGRQGDIRLTPLGSRRATPYHLDLGLDVGSVDVDTHGRIVVAGTAGVIRIAR